MRVLAAAHDVTRLEQGASIEKDPLLRQVAVDCLALARGESVQGVAGMPLGCQTSARDCAYVEQYAPELWTAPS